MSTPSPIEFDLRREKESSKTGEEGVNPGLWESYLKDSTGNGKWNGNTGRYGGGVRAVQPNAAPAPLRPRHHRQLFSRLNNQSLVTGGSGPVLRPMEGIHSYWGTETQRPFGFGYQKIKFLAIKYFIFTICFAWFVLFDLFWLFAHRELVSRRQVQLYSKEFAHALFIGSTVHLQL